MSGFVELLLLNMAVASVVACLCDAATQHCELWLKRHAKARRKAAAGAKQLARPPTETTLLLGDRARTFEAGDSARAKADAELENSNAESESIASIFSVSISGSKGSCAAANGGLFGACDGEAGEDVQTFDWKRSLRMMVVAGLVFDPMSFTWYYAILPWLVPGVDGVLSSSEMTAKVVWDIVVYGGVVSATSVAASAALQEADWAYVWKRLRSDLPLLYATAMILAVPADIPVFVFVPPKWQAAAFKAMDAVFMFAVSYVVNRKLSAAAGAPRQQRKTPPPAS
eukprot:gene5061-7775_t